MDKHSRITPTLFFILVNFIFGDFTSEIIVQTNGNFTLRPTVQGPLDEILWTWNGHKVVEFDQKEVVEFRQFKGRTILNLTTGALTLTRLAESDSGLYVCELLIKGLLEYNSQTVKVFDAVGKPAVSCQVKGTSVTLLCSGDNRPTTEYRWEGPAIEPQPGPQLEIEAAESSDSVYTCVLQNPVSQSRTDFPVKSCFPAPETSGINPLVIVLPLLFIFIIAWLLLFYKIHCKKLRRLIKNVHEMQQLSPEDTEVIKEIRERIYERIKQSEAVVSPGKTSDEHQERTLTELSKGTDGNAGISQESQAESLNEVEDSEERVQTEGRNSPEHLSSGTVLSSAPASPSATPPKTGSENNTSHTPESSLSPPKPPKSTPHSAQAPIQSQDQEEEPESSDETAAFVEKISKAEEDQLSHTTSIPTDDPQTSLSPPRPAQPSGQTEEQEEETESSLETAGLVQKIFKAEDDQLSHKTISIDVLNSSPSPPRPGQASGLSEEQEGER